MTENSPFASLAWTHESFSQCRSEVFYSSDEEARQHSLALSAQEVELGADALMRAVEDCTTVSQALELFKLASGLRNKLDQVVAKALEMADANSGK